MEHPYHIIEFANTHGGNWEYLQELVDTFEDITDNAGIKLQIFHPDKIATKDFFAYDLYQELYFEKDQWASIIHKIHSTKDVWLDIFDAYGVEVLQEQLTFIHGIKFQSSVLYNLEVFSALQHCDLSDKKVILNVAAQPIDDIRQIVDRVAQQLNPKEILLEFGYQAYPTALEDSGLSKIETIRQHFSNQLVFADHVDGKSDDAIWLPVVAAISGVNYIEKHVMLETRETKYDHFSSLTPARFRQMHEQVNRYAALKGKPFINEKETVYLENTIMVPLLKQDKKAGAMINAEADFAFRRSGKPGLNMKQITALQKTGHVLAVDKASGDLLQHTDFKKAVVATIIACRLKSSRLVNKALLPIGELSSVEYCIASALRFENVHHTILATSDLEQDAPLSAYTYQKNVVFHRGDAEDVIHRYLGIAEQLKIDVVIRVTADNPFIDNEICQILLQEHFLTGADYTTPKLAAVGTNVEIINVSALRKIKAHFPSANYSEYMTWYFQNNPDHFHLHFVDLPEALIRNYRLTLDYQEDLDLFNAIDLHFKSKGKKVFTLRDIYEYLDANPTVAATNQHISIRYKTDAQLIETLNQHTKIR